MSAAWAASLLPEASAADVLVTTDPSTGSSVAEADSGLEVTASRASVASATAAAGLRVQRGPAFLRPSDDWAVAESACAHTV